MPVAPAESATSSPPPRWLGAALLGVGLLSALLGRVELPLLGVGVPNLSLPLVGAMLLWLHRGEWGGVWRRVASFGVATGLLYGWALVASALGLFPSISLYYWVKYLGYPIFGVGVLVLIADPARKRGATLVMHGFLLLLAAVGIWEAVDPTASIFTVLRTEGSREIFPRVASLLVWPNQFGIVMGVGLVAGEILRHRGVIRGLWYGTSQLLFAVGVVQSGSRNAWATLGVGLALMAWRGFVPRRRIAGVSAAATVLLLVLPVSAYQLGLSRDALPVAHGLLSPQARADPSLSLVRESADLRVQLWRMVIDILRHEPLTGIGLEIFQLKVGEAVMHQVGFNAHSLPLNIAAELGLIGLGFFVFWGYRLWHSRAPGDRLSQTALVLLFGGQAVDCFVYDAGFMAVLVFFVASALSPGGPSDTCPGLQYPRASSASRSAFEGEAAG